jgi:hypothetical protein
MMKKTVWMTVFAMMLATTQAFAGEVKVTNAWTRATAPGQDTASVQLVITSRKDATLVGFASGEAEKGEIHETVMENGMMKMRPLESLPLPAKTPVTLGEGGTHLMLIGLRKPLRVGHKLPFALWVKFANGRTTILRLLAVIKPLDTRSQSSMMQMNAQPAAKAEPASQEQGGK